ncbi:(2,3-dihydroxybenzoyl)adenylate synthase [Pseudonocardia sp. Cha107L01]|uniref:(2,3-dihydroxybenzoyl)adenylate synthase n=1 Tax=Pseudonocardia sp. Cha107L01 TaxID=3457576 RepID=UPI00403E5B67
MTVPAGSVPVLDGFTPWPGELAERYRDAGYWRPDTLGGLLRAWAARSGDTVAVVDGRPDGPRLSYAELDRRADETAAGLRGLGIEPGDRVVVHLPNTVDFVVALFALLRCAAVPVLALPAHRFVEIEHFARLSDAVAYLIPDRHEGFDYRELAARVTEAVPSLRHVLVAGDPGEFTGLDALPAGPSVPLPEVDPGEVAVLLISGGTTGKPKLIPRTHRDYAYNARGSAEVCELTSDDVYLASLPIAHNFPLACPGLLGALGVGATVVLAPGPSPDVCFGLIERERVTVTALVPPMARMWVETAAWDTRDRSSLRLLQVGGAKLDADLARRIPPALGCAVQQVFGMAEGLLNFTRAGDSDELVAGTQGRPLSPADEIRVVDGCGTAVPPGEVGELWTRGPYTLRGYYRAAEYNATAFTADGFYRTGDLVRRLPSGHLVVEGRSKDVINRGGENVSAAALEEHLLAHPAIAQVAVLGVPDESVGERVYAVVTLEAGVERAPKLREIGAFLAERGLAKFFNPDKLVVRDELPLTGVGKIDKRELAAGL